MTERSDGSGNSSAGKSGTAYEPPSQESASGALAWLYRWLFGFLALLVLGLVFLVLAGLLAAAGT